MNFSCYITMYACIQNVVYGLLCHQSGWPSGLRRQTQDLVHICGHGFKSHSWQIFFIFLFWVPNMVIFKERIWSLKSRGTLQYTIYSLWLWCRPCEPLLITIQMQYFNLSHTVNSSIQINFDWWKSFCTLLYVCIHTVVWERFTIGNFTLLTYMLTHITHTPA